MAKRSHGAPPEMAVPGFADRLRSMISGDLNQARLAERAGISRSWLSELLSGGEPSVPVLIALAKAGGVSVQWLATGKAVPVTSLGGGIDHGDAGVVPIAGPPRGGLAEQEAEQYRPAAKGHLDRAVAAFLAGRIADAWRLRTNALDLAGYLPGDLVVVDRNRDACPGDVVVAQTETRRREDARTIWRIHAPPVLMPMSSDRTLLPTPLKEAIVTGVVIGLFRGRRGA